MTEADDKNAKHRKIDVRVVATEKEKMIFQRRLKNCQTTTNRLLANANHVNPVGTSSKLQDDLTIGASCSSSKLGYSKSPILLLLPFFSFCTIYMYND